MTLEEMAARLAAAEARIARLESAAYTPKPAAVAPAEKAIASDDDLDSQWGSPDVRKDPPRWKGPSYAGQPMSMCPPDYLETLASFFDWQAMKDDEAGKVDAKGRPTATWKRKDAARARGWAKRNANGVKAAPAAQTDDAASFDPERFL